MAKYLLLKHYRGAPAAVNDSRWPNNYLLAPKDSPIKGPAHPGGGRHRTGCIAAIDLYQRSSHDRSRITCGFDRTYRCVSASPVAHLDRLADAEAGKNQAS